MFLLDTKLMSEYLHINEDEIAKRGVYLSCVMEFLGGRYAVPQGHNMPSTFGDYVSPEAQEDFPVEELKKAYNRVVKLVSLVSCGQRLMTSYEKGVACVLIDEEVYKRTYEPVKRFKTWCEAEDLLIKSWLH